MPSKSKKQHDFMEAIAHNKAFAKKVHIPQSVGEEFVQADKGKHFKRGGQMALKKHEMNQAKELRRIADEEEHEAHEMKRGGHTKNMAHGGHAKKHHAEHEEHMKHGGKTKKMAMGGPGMDPRVAALMATRRVRRPVAAPAAPMAPAMGMKHGGLSKTHHKHLAEHHLSMAEHHMHMHTNGSKVKKMAKGGMAETMGPRTMSEDVEKGSNKLLKHGESAVQKKGHTKGMEPKMHNDGLNDIGTSGMKHGGRAKKYAHGGHVSAEAHHRADGIARKGHTKTHHVGMAHGGSTKKKYC